MEELMDLADSKKEAIAVFDSKTTKIRGYYTPKTVKEEKRKLGIWEGKGTFEWVGDGKITLEEFLGEK